MNALVICIGNKARGDDGAARLVGEILESALPPGVELVNEPQLDIVMAEDVAAATRVIVVDAERRASPAVRTQTLAPGTAGTNAHALDSAGLLALAGTLYGAVPPAILVSVASPDMGHGDGLSKTARAASEEAARTVLELLA